MSTRRRRARREVEVWLTKKQAEGKYLDRDGTRNGYEARRFLSVVWDWIEHGPAEVDDHDLFAIAGHLGPANLTKRFYLGLLGSFLSTPLEYEWDGRAVRRPANWVVQESRIRDRFPRRATRTPVIPREHRDAASNVAQRADRVILALAGAGRRAVEIRRARPEDVHLDDPEPWMAVRKKGGRGDPTGKMWLPKDGSVYRELRWWLPLREKWASQAREDSGHLVPRWDGDRLVQIGSQYVRRACARAEESAGVPYYPPHAYRRGAATMAREEGADWDEVAELLQDEDLSTVRRYVSRLLTERRMPAIMRALSVRPMWGEA